MSDPSTVYVFAPQGAGKSIHAQALCDMFGCARIVDEWDGSSPVPPGSLVLSNLVGLVSASEPTA